MTGTLPKIFQISRPISWINTAAPFVAGYILSGGELSWIFFLAVFFFLIPYNLVMYGVNDIYDYESDKLNPRKNSQEGAVVTPNQHGAIWISITILAVPPALILLSNGSLFSRIFLLVSLFMVVAYSMKGLRFKEKPFLDSFTSSWHFWSPFAYGVLMAGGLLGNYWLALVAFVCWGMASHAMGAIQDILYDREGNISSIATVLGASKTTLFSFICYLITCTISLFLPIYGPFIAITFGLYLLLAVACLRLSDKNSPNANRSWKNFLWINQVVGFVLTLSYIVSIYRVSILWLTIPASIVVVISYVYVIQKVLLKKDLFSRLLLFLRSFIII